MEWAVHNGETTIQLSVEKKNHNDIHNNGDIVVFILATIFMLNQIIKH
jgi:hypothetical protein